MQFSLWMFVPVLKSFSVFYQDSTKAIRTGPLREITHKLIPIIIYTLCCTSDTVLSLSVLFEVLEGTSRSLGLRK